MLFMEQVNIINQKGETIRNFSLDSTVWQTPFSRESISLTHRCYLSNQHQGTKKTKNKGEVSGGGKKP